MTKLSVQGGASSHLRPCIIGKSDAHNFRLDPNPTNQNIQPSLSHLNTTWADSSVPDLVEYDKKIRDDFFRANGRHMASRGRSKASPIKESVTNLPDGSMATTEMQKRYIKRIEEKFGVHCIRAAIHRDEYFERGGTFNNHGHEVWDFYDPLKHRMIRLTRADCRMWQDIVHEETKMPRGTPAYETRRRWYPPYEYKIRQQLEDLANNEKKLEEIKQNLAQAQAEQDSLDKQIKQGQAFKEFMTKNSVDFIQKLKKMHKYCRRTVNETLKEAGLPGQSLAFFTLTISGIEYRNLVIIYEESGTLRRYGLSINTEKRHIVIHDQNAFLPIETPMSGLDRIMAMDSTLFATICEFNDTNKKFKETPIQLPGKLKELAKKRETRQQTVNNHAKGIKR